MVAPFSILPKFGQQGDSADCSRAPIRTDRQEEWLRTPERVESGCPVLPITERDVLPLKLVRSQFDRWYLSHCLCLYGWNISRTAAALGISRRGLHLHIQQLRMQRRQSPADQH